MVQKAEGAFGSAWHGAGSLPMYVGGEVRKINDAWPGYILASGGTAGGSILAFIDTPALLGQTGEVKTYQAPGGSLLVYDAFGAVVWQADDVLFTYRTQPNPAGGLIPEHVIQIDASGTDSAGKEFGLMTPRLQGPRAGFGWVDFALTVADENTTAQELKKELRKPIP